MTRLMREQRGEMAYLQRKSESRRERKIIFDGRANYFNYFELLRDCALYPTTISSERDIYIYIRKPGVFIRHCALLSHLAKKVLIETPDRVSRARESASLFPSRPRSSSRNFYYFPRPATPIYLAFLIYFSTLKQINRIRRRLAGLLRNVKKHARCPCAFRRINYEGVREIAQDNRG